MFSLFHPVPHSRKIFFPSPPKMEENTVRQVHTAVLSMYKGDHRATQWLNAFGRSKVCSILTREM